MRKMPKIISYDGQRRTMKCNVMEDQCIHSGEEPGCVLDSEIAPGINLQAVIHAELGDMGAVDGPAVIINFDGYEIKITYETVNTGPAVMASFVIHRDRREGLLCYPGRGVTECYINEVSVDLARKFCYKLSKHIYDGKNWTCEDIFRHIELIAVHFRGIAMSTRFIGGDDPRCHHH